MLFILIKITYCNIIHSATNTERARGAKHLPVVGPH